MIVHFKAIGPSSQSVGSYDCNDDNCKHTPCVKLKKDYAGHELVITKVGEIATPNFDMDIFNKNRVDKYTRNKQLRDIALDTNKSIEDRFNSLLQLLGVIQ